MHAQLVRPSWGSFLGRVAASVVGLAALLLSSAAFANDRPFQVARTAVMEEDDQVWSFESWAQRFGTVRGLSFEPEYVFTQNSSLQGELTRYVDRTGAETGNEAELEYKYLVNSISVDGYGWGLSATLSAEHNRATGDTTKLIGIKIPVSIALWDGAYLHVNAGVFKTNDAPRAWSSSAGIEHAVTKRNLLFAEIAHEGNLVFGQVGLRHWLQRDKLAIDFSFQQQRSDGQRSSGFIAGVGWYDL